MPHHLSLSLTPVVHLSWKRYKYVCFLALWLYLIKSLILCAIFHHIKHAWWQYIVSFCHYLFDYFHFASFSAIFDVVGYVLRVVLYEWCSSGHLNDDCDDFRFSFAVPLNFPPLTLFDANTLIKTICSPCATVIFGSSSPYHFICEIIGCWANWAMI